MRLFLYFLLVCSLSFAEENDLILPRLDVEIAHEFYQILHEVDEIFSANEIEFWAICGTLLGAIRHQGIIPWDDDVDLAIFDSDLAKLISLKNEFEKRGLVLLPLRDYLKIFPKEGKKIIKEDGTAYPWQYPFIDIFPMGIFENKVTYLSDRIREKVSHQEWFDAKKLRPFRRALFGPTTIPLPNHANDYLKNTYGEDCFEFAYAQYDHALEKKRERIKVKIKDFSPAPWHTSQQEKRVS